MLVKSNPIALIEYPRIWHPKTIPNHGFYGAVSECLNVRDYQIKID